MATLKWNQPEDIALALYEKYPDVDPIAIRYTDLRKWVTELPDFADVPEASNEAKLEAIQMAWLEEYQSDRE